VKLDHTRYRRNWLAVPEVKEINRAPDHFIVHVPGTESSMVSLD
jgi:hypothetical protein